MAGRAFFVLVFIAGLISSTDSDYTNVQISGLFRNSASIRQGKFRKINRHASITSRNDTKVNGKSCPIENVTIVNQRCNQGAPDFDREGHICANDGEDNEAYCSYEVGETACAYCKATGDNDNDVNDKKADDTEGDASKDGDPTNSSNDDKKNSNEGYGNKGDDGNDKNPDDDKGDVSKDGDEIDNLNNEKQKAENNKGAKIGNDGSTHDINSDADKDEQTTAGGENADDKTTQKLEDYEAVREDLYQNEADGENSEDETDDETTKTTEFDETGDGTNETTTFDFFEEETTSPPNDEDDDFSFDAVMSIQQPPQDNAARQLNASKKQLLALKTTTKSITTPGLDVHAEMFGRTATNSSGNETIEVYEDPREAAIRAMFRFQRMQEALRKRAQLDKHVKSQASPQPDQQHRFATATATSAASATATVDQPVPTDWLPKSIVKSLISQKNIPTPIRHQSAVKSGSDTESAMRSAHEESRFQMQRGSMAVSAGSGSGPTPLQLELSRARDQAVIAYMGNGPHPMNSPWNPLLREQSPHSLYGMQPYGSPVRPQPEFSLPPDSTESSPYNARGVLLRDYSPPGVSLLELQSSSRIRTRSGVRSRSRGDPGLEQLKSLLGNRGGIALAGSPVIKPMMLTPAQQATEMNQAFVTQMLRRRAQLGIGPGPPPSTMPTYTQTGMDMDEIEHPAITEPLPQSVFGVGMPLDVGSTGAQARFASSRHMSKVQTSQSAHVNPLMGHPMVNPLMGHPMANPLADPLMGHPMANPLADPLMVHPMANPLADPLMGHPITNTMTDPLMGHPMANTMADPSMADPMAVPPMVHPMGNLLMAHPTMANLLKPANKLMPHPMTNVLMAHPVADPLGAQTDHPMGALSRGSLNAWVQNQVASAPPTPIAGLNMYYKGKAGGLSDALTNKHLLGMPLGELGGPRSLVPPPMPPLPGSGPPPPPAELIIDTPDVMKKPILHVTPHEGIVDALASHPHEPAKREPFPTSIDAAFTAGLRTPMSDIIKSSS